MAKFLVTVWPYTGSLNPLIAVAHALTARGHTVAFYTGTRARKLIEEQGFEYFPLGKSLDEHIEWLLSSPHGAGRHWGPRPEEIVSMLRAFFLDPIPQQIADLDVILAEWMPNAILCEPAMWGPRLILYEARKIPVAMLELPATTLPGPDVSPIGLGLPPPRNWYMRLRARLGGAILAFIVRDIRRSASKLRQHYGLEPLESSVIALIAKLPLVIVPSCPEFDYNRRDLPPSVHYVGPCPWYPPPKEPLRWLTELPRDRPWVHVSEGTMYTQKPLVLRAAVRGLANQPMQVIMTTGTQRDPGTLHLGRLAPNILIKTWVSYSELFPNTDVAVTHGGGGTVIAALSAGVPMIVVPLMWDQPENAQRVVEARAGIRLSPQHCTPNSLREAVEHVLGDPSYRQNAERLASSLRHYGGPTQAAELLEGIVPG